MLISSILEASGMFLTHASTAFVVAHIRCGRMFLGAGILPLYQPRRVIRVKMVRTIHGVESARGNLHLARLLASLLATGSRSTRSRPEIEQQTNKIEHLKWRAKKKRLFAGSYLQQEFRLV